MTNAVSRNRNTSQRFIVSDSNRLAYAMAMNALDHPGPATSPLLICGGIGTGKTHLLKALEHYLQVFHPEKKVKLITADRCKIDFIRALTQMKMDVLMEQYENLDVLLVDDLQVLIHHDTIQEYISMTARQLLENGQTLIFTSDRVPDDLKNLKKELFSVIVSNQIVALETADVPLKKQILWQKALATAHKDIPNKNLEKLSWHQKNIRYFQRNRLRLNSRKA